MKEDFSLKIVDLRKRRGLTQVALARLLDITPRSVANYEAGLRTPNKMTALKLALYCPDPIGRQVFMKLAGLNEAQTRAFELSLEMGLYWENKEELLPAMEETTRRAIEHAHLLVDVPEPLRELVPFSNDEAEIVAMLLKLIRSGEGGELEAQILSAFGRMLAKDINKESSDLDGSDA